jgi:enoyl-CoA hydratase/carnithine racemase
MELVHYRIEDRIAILTIDNPPVNALSVAVQESLREAAARGMNDSDVDAVILLGARNTFIAGADISEFPAMRNDADQARAYREAPNRAIAALTECHKPVVEMISGVCIGGGVQVALSCDVRIAARGTRFGVPAARLGLAYPLDGVNALSNIVGPANARDILLSARLFDAEEALHMGLVNRLVDQEKLEENVRDYCLKMATNAPLTMAAAKVAIRESLKDREERDAKTVSTMVARCFDSDDYREGVRAFLEKRRPAFAGR